MITQPPLAIRSDVVCGRCAWTRAICWTNETPLRSSGTGIDVDVDLFGFCSGRVGESGEQFDRQVMKSNMREPHARPGRGAGSVSPR